MKYKVIGWTFSDNYDIESVPLTFAARHAIVDDIRENNYLFSGLDHQESCMVVPFLMMERNVLVLKGALQVLWLKLTEKLNFMLILNICLR